VTNGRGHVTIPGATLRAVGLLDRLLGRSRYVAGTTPESAGEAAPEAPEWVGSAPPEPEAVDLPQWEDDLNDEVAADDGATTSSDYVTAEDVALAYGFDDVSVSQDTPVDEITIHVVADGGEGRGVEIYLSDHRAYPGLAKEDEDAWRDTGVVDELSGVADAAFVNGDGTVFARLGEEWTIQVMPAGWDPPVVHSADLAGRIVERLRRPYPIR
jgi:hypothetical protein